MRQLLIIKIKTVVQNRQLSQYISWLSNEYYLYRYSNNNEICVRKLRHNLYGRREKGQKCERTQSTSKIRGKQIRLVGR